MKMLAAVAFLVWGAVFLVGLLVLVYRTAPLPPIAFARIEMPANHLIRTGDLEMGADDFIGKYVHSHVIEHQKLTLHDVFAAPLLLVKQGPLFAVETPASGIGADVEAQKKGMICRNKSAIAAAEAVAFLCAPKDEGGNCVAILRTQPEDTKKLAQALVKSGQSDLSFKADCK